MQDVDERTIWVASDAGLEKLCSDARAAGSVGLDTEFERTDTYYARLALVQFAIGDAIALVDPLTIEDAAPLRALLEDPATAKVMHSCSEDVEVLGSWCNARPQALFDTQIAAAFCGDRFGIGYRDLVAQQFGIDLDKDETRSDWIGRPLTAAQQRYAALDVALLLPLYTRQREQLLEQGRLEWLVEECERTVTEVMERPGPLDAWRNVKRAATLGRRGLAALQRLAAWREVEARRLDRPRGWLVRDEQLILISERLPERIEQLAGEGLPHGVVRRFGDDLQALLDGVRSVSDADLPEALPAPLGRSDGERLKALRKVARERAQALGLAEELLSRKRMLEPLFLDGASVETMPLALRGWRWEVLGDDLRAVNAAGALR